MITISYINQKKGRTDFFLSELKPNLSKTKVGDCIYAVFIISDTVTTEIIPNKIILIISYYYKSIKSNYSEIIILHNNCVFI